MSSARSANAAGAAAALEATGRCAAADRLVAQYAGSLQRCGAEDGAADLVERLMILRWKALRAPTAPADSRPFTDADRGVCDWQVGNLQSSDKGRPSHTRVWDARRKVYEPGLLAERRALGPARGRPGPGWTLHDGGW